MEKLIQITVGNAVLEGMLKVPSLQKSEKPKGTLFTSSGRIEDLVGGRKLTEEVNKAPKGIVLFAHGSGSSRLSPRNNFVASVLTEAGLATLLIDLLSPKEDAAYETRFDIPLLAERLQQIVRWLQKEPETAKRPIGLFGSSTGAAAALEVAAILQKQIGAVVSRGGRPDLAIPSLQKVTAPTLLIVGGDDFGVIELNESAYAHLRCPKKMQIVPHATHLFEEPGCLEEVARLAKEWFSKHLQTPS
jgi:putative phosphoribosyl transferase